MAVTDDGVTFDRFELIRSSEPASCDFTNPGECILDPAFLALPDGRLVLYFTWWKTLAEGQFAFDIGRAFAVD
jgi:hypothetical protein